MNYFAHGCDFVDDPYFLAGTALPDWLSVVDRRVRVRSRHALGFVDHEDRRIARFARGIVQHHQDDAWFHETRAFAELSLQLAASLRRVLPGDEGFRPHFLGHILVEILLDAALVEDRPGQLQQYYQALDSVVGDVIQQAVNRMAPRGTSELAAFVHLFSQERFLWDYADDGKLFFRLNQVMRRVGLPVLPPHVQEIFPAARTSVRERKAELMCQRASRP